MTDQKDIIKQLETENKTLKFELKEYRELINRIIAALPPGSAEYLDEAVATLRQRAEGQT